MNRKEAAELLPIIKAFIEGKTIQINSPDGIWKDMDYISFIGGNPKNYRIKPEPKYRPFANAEECWKEMRKHEPFGWVIKKSNDREYNIQSVLIKEDVLYIRSSYVELVIAFNDYNFADGIPFGVKVEE
jgi:hypothetical protein